MAAMHAFMLHFFVAAAPGAGIALIAFAVFGLPERQRKITQKETDEAFPLITRPSINDRLYGD